MGQSLLDGSDASGVAAVDDVFDLFGKYQYLLLYDLTIFDDIDGDVVKAARENAKRAGVDHLIHFQQRPVAELSHPKKYGFLITNPPYGERLEDKKDLPALYQTLGERYRALDSWSMYLITSYEDAERYLGKKADKNRKIYNGMLKTYFYQYAGPKPPRREKEQK